MAEKPAAFVLPTSFSATNTPQQSTTQTSWSKTFLKGSILASILLYLATSSSISSPIISSTTLLTRAQDVFGATRHKEKAFVSVECDEDVRGKEGFDCGYFEVPLDHINKTDTRLAQIAFTRYSPPIPKSQKLGSIFVNPGGPGGSGSSMVARAGPSLSLLQGGLYDVIGFDPRGIGKTRPKMKCFADETSETIHGMMSGERMPIYPRGNLTTEEDLRDLTRDLKRADAVDKAAAGSCLDPEGAARYMSTAHVVRDIAYMASKLTGPTTPINFQGFSYGTTVGTYLVSMFPDRVGRVVIDGVMHVPSWFDGPHYKMGGEHYFGGMELAWEAFLVECAKAGPARCALAEDGLDGPGIGAKVDDLLERLFQDPMPVPNAKIPSILTPANIRARMFRGLYNPRGFQVFARDLQDAIDGNGAPIVDAQLVQIESNTTKPASGGVVAGFIVGFTDAPPPNVKEEDKIPLLTEQIVMEQQTYSRHFTGILPHMEEGWNWNFTASERFAGPVASELSYPMLIVGNTFDNICPLANALTMHSLIKDSRMIHQDTPGHCSTALTSLCTVKIIQDYYTHGTLPSEDVTFCSPDEELFPARNQVSIMADHPLTLASIQIGEALAEASMMRF